MQGNDRVRHCTECNLNVYNFAAMTDLEVERLIAKTRGRLCARIYRRADGTILTQNCPVGLRTHIKKISRIAGAALSAAMSVTFAWAQAKTPPKQAIVKSEGQASLKVTATNGLGTVIPNAKIILENTFTHQKFGGFTNAGGVLTFSQIPAGEYKLSGEAPAFASSRGNLVLRSDETQKMEIVLKEGNLQMGVMVVGDGVPSDLLDLPSKITE
jgi:hypothetical protein